MQRAHCTILNGLVHSCKRSNVFGNARFLIFPKFNLICPNLNHFCPNLSIFCPNLPNFSKFCPKKSQGIRLHL